MRDHRKLRAFQHADNLALLAYRATKSFPKSEMFGLVSQMRRASVSAASNIVEGCARHGEADYLRFLDMAYGSVKELEYQTSLAFRLGFMPQRSHDEMSDLCAECARTLNGLINALRHHRRNP